jgi:transposase
MDSFRRDTLLAELDHFQTQIRRVTRRLDEIGHKHPGLAILRTIPGVGARTAEAVVAFIDDPGRFPRVRSIGSYFGLVPCQDQSAGRNHLGRITRAGPATVRKLVVEASWQAIRRSETVRARFERVMRGDPNRKKIALVATAHHLLRVMLAMLRTGEVCRWSPETT